MGRWRSIVVGLGAALCIGVACSCNSGGGGGGGGEGGGVLPAVAFQAAFGGRAFTNPVKLVQHPTDDDRWYVVEQGGLVKTFLASNDAITTVAADVGALVNLGTGEQGLLGMAIDPNFDTSGEIYLAYTDDTAGTSILARWVSPDDDGPFALDSVVLSIPHPRDNHNGGDIMFGPDGFLYYSMGDGGGADDPDDNGQDPNALLGKIMRLDVNAMPPAGETYAIPTTNPFFAVGRAHCDGDGVGTEPCPEIFALGFRNPWRMNFDPENERLYVGDVGQSEREEIDLVTAGGNYGWDCMEGDIPHPTTASCSGPFVPPEVAHDFGSPQAITGGAVYRASAIPNFHGFYVYADFYSGAFFAFDSDVPDAPSQRLNLTETFVAAFGQDRSGEVYTVGFGSPSIQKIVPGPGG